MTFLAAAAAAFRPFENNALWAIAAIAVLALLFGLYLRREVLSAPEGTEKMRSIARAVQEGSAAYLNRQLRTVAMFAAVLAFVLLALPVHPVGGYSAWAIRIGRSIAFVIGALASGTTGFMGMWLSVRGNVRVAAASADGGLRRAMTLAFRTGGVAGMLTVGLGLLAATAFVIIFKQAASEVLEGLAFGAALLAMFMRVGGGIFTKAADVGADLVGKVEQGIPEDDPRNAATIADNVGDNVGDCAGMAADLFESYQVTLAASVILGAVALAGRIQAVLFPLMVMGIGVIVAMIGIMIVVPRSEDEPGMRAISRGFFVSAVLAAAGVFLVAEFYLKDLRAFWAVVLGLALASVIQLITEHYTSTTRRPVKDIAEASLTGPATNILSGFSAGLESTVWSILIIGVVITACFYLGHNIHEQLYFVSLAGIGMLSTVGVIVSMDTFGPVSDNAQGIAEMSGDLEGRPAEILTSLDAIGNSTKAITKGVAIATAVLAATSLFGAFTSATGQAGFHVRVDTPLVLVGLLVGGSVAFLFSSFAIRAVGRAASQVVFEVRKQFREHPGIMDFTETPDYSAVVDIVTKSSLRELVTPGLLAVLAPIIVGFLLQAEALGAFLAGAILTGQLMAVMLANSGGAWDNAKKLVEEGRYGGKGSETHNATVIGDTVGDPFKDTAGPALNPMIKVMNLVALLIVPVIVEHTGSSGGGLALRLVVGLGAAIVLAVAIWVAKARRSDLGPGSEERAPAAAPAAASE